MVTNPTPTLGLSRPPFNITTWHDDVNGNMAVIDAALSAFGIYSNIIGVWANSTEYTAGNKAVDEDNGKLYLCNTDHTSPGTGSFEDYRTANPMDWTLVTQGYVPRGEWVTATNYHVNDMVFSDDGQRILIGLTEHTSGVLADDITNGEWQIIFDITGVVTDIETLVASLSGLASISPSDKRLIRGNGATFVGFDPASNVTSILEASNYAAIRTLLSVYSAAAVDAGFQPLDADLTAIAALVTTTFGRSLLTQADAAAARTTLGISPGVVGQVIDYAGTSAPTGWLFCYGQAISRTTYSDLFAAISTTFGVGDGSTTFNVPDLRGRTIAGKDDMGGTSANRLTGASGGLNGDNLGATGGVETHTLTTAELATHTHTASTDSQGSHSHSLTAALHSSSTTGGVGSDPVNNAPNSGISTNSAGAHTHTVTVNNAGSGSAHNNVQPTIIMNKLIYAGV